MTAAHCSALRQSHDKQPSVDDSLCSTSQVNATSGYKLQRTSQAHTMPHTKQRSRYEAACMQLHAQTGNKTLFVCDVTTTQWSSQSITGMALQSFISIYITVTTRDCNPGIPGFPNPGIPEIFQSRNPGIECSSIPGFRDWKISLFNGL